MATAIVPLSSELKRKAWLREGLIQGASKSFWAPYTGKTADSIIYVAKEPSAKSGHTVVFDFDGNLSGKAIKGKETAYGKGEQKRKFSDKITVERYRMPVDNGDSFDGVDIGDLSITQHSDSRAKLADLYVRFKDQAIFDTGQGIAQPNTAGSVYTPSHTIDLVSTFNFNTLVDLETTLRTSQGFTTGGIRAPLKPFMMSNGEPIWLYVIDAAQAAMLRKDTAGYQTLVRSGDFRGNMNANFTGLIGKLGRLLIVEAGNFFGFTTAGGGTGGAGFGIDDSEVEMSGLRQYDATNAAWTGMPGFDYATSSLKSRGMLMGAGAIQFAMGKEPDYKFQESQDFAINAESALETWLEVKKTRLIAENQKYKQAKVSEIDYGVVVTDVKVN